jgi:hypothetical protein
MILAFSAGLVVGKDTMDGNIVVKMSSRQVAKLPLTDFC